MLHNYLAIAFFAAFGLFVPVAYVLGARLMSLKDAQNPVKNAPFESAEESIGSERDVANEYLPYLALFLPFEMILVVLVLWSTAARAMTFNSGLAIAMLSAVSALFAVFGYKLANSGAHG